MTRVLDIVARALISSCCWVAHRIVPHVPLVRGSLLLSCPVAWGCTRWQRFDRWWWGGIDHG